MTRPPLLTADELRAEIDAIEAHDPALWRKCYPRIYDDPPARCGSYYSTKMLGVNLFGVAQKWRLGYVGDCERFEFLWASRLACYRVPIFWLSKELIDALLKTMPMMDIAWHDMKLPFEAAVFMVPKGTLPHTNPEEGECSFVSYARSRNGEQWQSPLLPGVRCWLPSGGMVFVADTVVAGHLLHWNVPYDELHTTISLPNVAAWGDTAHFTTPHASGYLNPPHMSVEDNRWMARAVHVIFGALLLMLHRPDLLQAGQLRKRVPGKANLQPKEFWSPALLGANYRVRRDYVPQGGTHASPRLHWVIGHWKHQPYGPRSSLRKEIWLEPFLRAAGPEEK